MENSVPWNFFCQLIWDNHKWAAENNIQGAQEYKKKKAVRILKAKNSANLFDRTDIYKISHPKTAENVLFWCAECIHQDSSC